MPTLAQRITWLVSAEQQLRPSLSGELLDLAPAPQAQLLAATGTEAGRWSCTCILLTGLVNAAHGGRRL